MMGIRSKFLYKEINSAGQVPQVKEKCKAVSFTLKALNSRQTAKHTDEIHKYIWGRGSFT